MAIQLRGISLACVLVGGLLDWDKSPIHSPGASGYVTGYASVQCWLEMLIFPLESDSISPPFLASAIPSYDRLASLVVVKTAPQFFEV